MMEKPGKATHWTHLCWRGFLSAVAAALLSGCTLRYYVDPGLLTPATGDFDLRIRPRAVNLIAKFEGQGWWGTATGTATAVDFFDFRSRLLQKTTEALQRSGLVSEFSLSDDADRLVITMTDETNWAEGFKELPVIFTFGLLAPFYQYVEKYAFTVTYTPAGKTPIQKEYHRQSYQGFRIPSGYSETFAYDSLDRALDRVLDDVIITLLRDLKREGDFDL